MADVRRANDFIPTMHMRVAFTLGGDFNLASPSLVWRVIKIRLVTAFIITRLTAL